MPLYFAYGSNMDESAMAGRCPNSQALGTAVLHRHRFVIMQEGYASVVRDPRSSVYGLLWDVALSDVRALDRYESVATGLYRKITQPVKRIGGEGVRPLQQALVYVGHSDGGGAPLPGYLEGVLAAAERLEFPPAYRAALAGLANAGGQKVTRSPARSPVQSPARAAQSVRAAPVTADRDEAGNIKVRPRFASPLDRS